MKKMNDPCNRIIGGNIRRIRRDKKSVGVKMGPQHIAKHIDVSTQQVSKYEVGKNRIPASTLFRIAQCLEVRVEDLFEGCQ